MSEQQADGPPYAAADWQAKGYTSPEAEIEDMANVGRALMEALPQGYIYNDCPSEIVVDLQNQIDELKAAAPPSDAEAATIATMFECVRREVEEASQRDSGRWVTCTGCYEGVDGQNVNGFPYSEAFGCVLGGGCGECGGIGALWDTTDYAEMAEFMLADEAAHGKPIPCPRCGKVPVVWRREGQRLIGHDPNDGTSVFCEFNTVVPFRFTDDDADVIALWNDIMGGVARETAR